MSDIKNGSVFEKSAYKILVTINTFFGVTSIFLLKNLADPDSLQEQYTFRFFDYKNTQGLSFGSLPKPQPSPTLSPSLKLGP